MILKGICTFALVWFCVGQGPQIDLGPALACQVARCTDPLAVESGHWRDVIGDRLVAMQGEFRALHDNSATQNRVAALIASVRK